MTAAHRRYPLLVALAMTSLMSAMAAAQDPVNIARLPVKLKTLEGKPADLPKLLGSKLTVLNLWATWCQPCRREIPYLSKLDKEFKGKGVKVIGVSLDKTPDGVAAAGQKLGAKYPVLFGGEPYGAALDVKGIPVTLILDKKGALIEVLIAEVTDENLTPKIKAYLDLF